jgi:hypothetical protein
VRSPKPEAARWPPLRATSTISTVLSPRFLALRRGGRLTASGLTAAGMAEDPRSAPDRGPRPSYASTEASKRPYEPPKDDLSRGTDRPGGHSPLSGPRPGLRALQNGSCRAVGRRVPGSSKTEEDGTHSRFPLVCGVPPAYPIVAEDAFFRNVEREACVDLPPLAPVRGLPGPHLRVFTRASMGRSGTGISRSPAFDDHPGEAR